MTPDEADALVRERLDQTKVLHQYDRHPQLMDTLASPERRPAGAGLRVYERRVR